mgnify:CR=1 FL=1|jgi:hypothetical protein
MGKKIIGVIVFIAITATASWNNQQDINKFKLSDLALENVEALAQGEWGQGGICYQNIQYDHVFPNNYILYCGECRYILGFSYWNTNFCLHF